MKRMDITVSKQYEENKSTRLGWFHYGTYSLKAVKRPGPFEGG